MDPSYLVPENDFIGDSTRANHLGEVTDPLGRIYYIDHGTWIRPSVTAAINTGK